MRSAWLLLVLGLVGCKKTATTSSPPPDASAPSAPMASAAPSASTGAGPIVFDARSPVAVAKAWNEAMTRHDTAALAQIYAPEVTFYGTKMANAKAVAAKAAAFAKTPDYAQSIGGISEDGTLDGDVHVLHFTKTTTEHGQTKDFPAKLVVSGGHVVEEGDDRKLASTWCLDSELNLTDKVVPPFKLSANDAYGFVARSKYLAKLQKEKIAALPDEYGFGCAEDCTSADHRCDYTVRIKDASSTATSNLVDWVYVDPKSGTMWREDVKSDGGSTWVSEAPTPLK